MSKKLKPKEAWCEGSCRDSDCRGNDDCPRRTKHVFDGQRWKCAGCGGVNNSWHLYEVKP